MKSASTTYITPGITDQYAMNKQNLKSICSPILSTFPTKSALVALFASLSLFSSGASSQPGYAQRVKTECAKAGRSVPDFSVNDCNICHKNANNMQAYQSGNFLDVLCQISANPVDPGTNTAPMLEHMATPQTAYVGQLFKLPIAASDSEDDLLKLSAKSLPAGAKLKQVGKVNGKWTAELRWKPKKKQAGKSFTVKLIAAERKRKPSLVATESVTLFVAEPAAGIQAMTIAQSRYESGTLSVSGRVSPSSPGGVDLLIKDLHGTSLGMTRLEGDAWSASIPMESQSVPCVLRIEALGATLAVAPVHTAETGCR